MDFRDGNDNLGSHKYGAEIAIGTRVNNLELGYRHLSQPFVGFPFNDDMEYSRNELYISYEIKLGDIWNKLN